MQAAWNGCAIACRRNSKFSATCNLLNPAVVPDSLPGCLIGFVYQVLRVHCKQKSSKATTVGLPAISVDQSSSIGV
jgi:hypothetical protein